MSFRYAPPVKGITAAIGSMFGKKEKAEDNALEFGKDGEPLYKEDIIKRVLEDLEVRRGAKSALERQWTLNANFLVGNQYCEINTYRDGIEQLEPVYDWLERETFNQIAPLIETRVANLKKINYMMRVKPATNELDDYMKAEVSSSVLQYTQKASDFESKKNTMIYWNELCGNCFWLSWWNKDKGEKYAVEEVVEINEDGSERRRERAFYQGDLEYGLLTPYEVFPESIFKQTVEAQRSIILEQVKSVDEIKDLYGVQVKPSSVETFELTPVVSGGGLGYESTVMGIGHRTEENCARVVTYFENPSKSKPFGQMIIIVGGEHLAYYGDLPYQRIPIIQTVCREIPGQFFGKSTIEDLIPRQKALNGVINRIHEYIKRVAIGNLAVEEGSVDIEEYEENGVAPGAMLVYKNGFNPPVPVPNGALPGELMTERYNLKNDMEYAAGVSQLMVNGLAPSGITSGTAISNLMEIDNTRLSLTGDQLRNSVRKLSVLWLEIYKRYATTKRIVNYVGLNDIGKAIVWSQNDINSYDVDYVTENELLMSEDVQKQRFFEAYNMGLFTDSEGRIPERVKLRALEFMKVGSYSEMLNMNALQMQAAQRENVFFENGVVPQAGEFDDDEIHIEEHKRYVLQMDFRLLMMKKPEYAKALENHIKEHMARVTQKQTEAFEQMQMMNGRN